jgi:hypothetical protein
MKVLLSIAHYYRAEEDGRYASTGNVKRDVRAAVLQRVIEAWRGHFSESSILNIGRKAFEPVGGGEDSLDIVVLVRGDDHLLDPEFCVRHRIAVIQVQTDDPRKLPFGAHSVFADARLAYDMFVYSEDDLRPPDGFLLRKIAGFSEEFGWRRLLMPNRYEWNLKGPALKTFIDGDLKSEFVKPYLDALPDESLLKQKLLGREINFVRARNPHSGFFALSAEQLEYWIQQPHFNDLDCSFIEPLESAATLGVMKTFPIYKTYARDLGWLEIEHLDRRYSDLKLPRIGRKRAP